MQPNAQDRGILLARELEARVRELEQRVGMLTELDEWLAKIRTQPLRSGTSAGVSLEDLDGDTKVQVEESSDEDKIRMDTGGTERAVLDSTALALVVPLKTDTISEKTGAAGVTIDTAKLKDSKIYPVAGDSNMYFGKIDSNFFLQAAAGDFIHYNVGLNKWYFYIGTAQRFTVDTSAISAKSKPIQDVTDPTNDQDAATKKYLVDNAILKSLLTTRGDMIRRGAAAPERFAKGSSGNVLRMADANDPGWSAPGISDTNIVRVDGSPSDDEYARWTATGLEGRTEAQFKSDFNLEDADINTLAVAAVEAANPLDMTNAIQVDDINEHTATDGVTIDASAGAGQGTHIKDNVIYPRKDLANAYITVSAAGDMSFVFDTGDLFSYDISTNVWALNIGAAWRFKADGLNSEMSSAWPLNMGGNDITAVKTVGIDSTPANDTCSGITAELTAGAALTRGNFCYVGADGKMEKALATAEATSRVIAVVEEATIAEDATGTFLLHGFIEKEFNFGTVGAKIYLSDDTAGAHDETQPAGTDETVVILGIALAADCLYFNPSVQAIVEHT